MVLVSGNIRFMGIFAGGSLERVRQTIVGLSNTAISSTFARCLVRCFGFKANIVIYYYSLHRLLSVTRAEAVLKRLLWAWG